jgi:hypothetical protein
VKAASGSVAGSVAEDWPYRRQLTALEAKAGLDPAAMDAQATLMVQDLMGVWPEVAASWRQDLADTVEAALAAGKVADLASLGVDSTAAAAQIEAAMVNAVQEGFTSAVAEAQAQGVTLDKDLRVPEAKIRARAEVMASLLGQSLATAAGREALRLSTSAVDPATVAASVLAYLEGMSSAWTRDQLASAVNDGMNTGRVTAMRALPEARYFASEVRDLSTCGPCLAVDGHEFSSLEEAEAMYASGGFIDCEGGLRCRGIIVADYGVDG